MPLAAVTVRVVPGPDVKVAVRVCVLLPMLKVQGDVVPAQVVLPPFEASQLPLQPVNTEPALGVAVIVPVALLSRDREQVPVQLAGVGAGATPENDTVPVPVPAKVMSRFLESVNVACAVAPDVKPLALTMNFMSRS